MSETIQILRRQLQEAIDNGPPADQMRAAIDYYYGRRRGDETEGRSQVQSLDVADMVHAAMAQILPSFAGDRVCEFEPDGPGDETIARLESEAVNMVMMESGRGYVVFSEAIKDALLLKNAIVKVYMSEDRDGKQRVEIRAVDPLCFEVHPGQDSVLLDGEASVFERKTYTRGQLVRLGFSRDKVSEIPPGDDGLTDTAYARQPTQAPPVQSGAEWATEEVTIWEAYAQLPDGDTTSLRRVLFGGHTILSDEPADFVPYATGSGFPEPHKFWGLSYYDRLKTVQDVKTFLVRQWADNIAGANNSRTAVNDAVHIPDLLDTRPAGVVRVKGLTPVAEALMPLPVLDAGPAAQTFLAYMDQVRADRGGAVLQMANAEAQLVGGQIGSQGVDRIYSVQEQLAGMIARNLAETLLRSAFLLVHTLLRTAYTEELVLRAADRWLAVDPRKWRPRVRVNLKSGLSPGERSRKAAAAAQVLQYQQMALQAGMDGVLVTLPNLYNALMDWTSAMELDAGEKYFTDPASQTAQQGSASKAQQQQQAQALQMQLTQAQLQLEAQKLQLDRYKADMENRIKVWTEQLHAEIEEAKIIGTATADLQRTEAEGRFALAQAEIAGAAGGGGGGGEAD